MKRAHRGGFSVVCSPGLAVTGNARLDLRNVGVAEASQAQQGGGQVDMAGGLGDFENFAAGIDARGCAD